MKNENYSKRESDINYNYSTIKITKSRIDKGLLAIPVSLTDRFPSTKRIINVFLDSSETPLQKSFTPYDSSSRECRIGGMKEFFLNNNIQDNDEIVIEFLDKENLRIIAEKRFKELIVRAQKSVTSDEEQEFEESVSIIEKLTNENKSTILKNEYVRLVKDKMETRKHKQVNPRFVKEGVPKSLRKILEEVYLGKCQVSGFTFLTKSGNPYFELHHIKPEFGNHLKNLLVVSPNVHVQFTFAHVKEIFDTEGWLREVFFNEENFKVTQTIDKIAKDFYKEIYE
jgi:hypothetical protein